MFENNCNCDNSDAELVKIFQFSSLQIWYLMLSLPDCKTLEKNSILDCMNIHIIVLHAPIFTQIQYTRESEGQCKQEENDFKDCKVLNDKLHAN